MNIAAQTQRIYNSLQDDLSKRLFENRLLYSLTSNYDFIEALISLSFDKAKAEEYKSGLRAILPRYNSIVVYGAGNFGQIFFELLGTEIEGYGSITAFCDGDVKKQGGGIFHGYDVISPAQLKEKYSGSVVVIAVAADEAISQITKTLLELGFMKEQIKTLKSEFRNVILPYRIANIDKKQYFDPDIILPKLEKDEVFIDAGSFDFQTSMQFAGLCNNEYKKIIAFEPNPKQYPICVENAKTVRQSIIHPYGLWSENTQLSFTGDLAGAHVSDVHNANTIKINTVALDNILNGEKATFIKLDVEGAELNALIGAKQTILQYRPKLAVCLYHKTEDIWEIPDYILSLHSDYKLYIRHYTFWRHETVLYAV